MRAADDVDVLLVGSGVAAAITAQCLLHADPNTSILMLEAGDRIPEKDRRTWWDYVATGRLPYDYTYDKKGANAQEGNTPFKVRGSRVTALGGTTLHWGGWSLRMQPEDFQLFSRTGMGGDWLVGYDDLEGYYCEAERLLSVGGDSADLPARSQPYPLPPYPLTEADSGFVKAFETKGLKPGHMPLARYRKCMTTGTCRYCPVGARFSAQHIVEALEDGPYDNFEVRTGATVTEILMDSHRRARGVAYLDRASGEQRRVDAATVVICAGAFESPKLLMRSVGPFYEHGVGNDADLVGRYLVSHSFLSVNGTAPTNETRMTSEFGFPTVMSRSWDDETRQATGKVFLFRNQNMPGQDWARHMRAGKTRQDLEAMATGKRAIGLSAFYEEFGRRENRLQPKAGTDQFGLPLMRIHFDRGQNVGPNAHLRLGEMEQIFDRIPDATRTEKGSQFEGAAGFHASGTCRMGETPEDGVTDADLRVHGIDNLYVCSNAVFPSVGAVNPTLTLAALALRLGDHLSGRPEHRFETAAETVA